MKCGFGLLRNSNSSLREHLIVTKKGSTDFVFGRDAESEWEKINYCHIFEPQNWSGAVIDIMQRIGRYAKDGYSSMINKTHIACGIPAPEPAL